MKQFREKKVNTKEQKSPIQHKIVNVKYNIRKVSLEETSKCADRSKYGDMENLQDVYTILQNLTEQ